MRAPLPVSPRTMALALVAAALVLGVVDPLIDEDQAWYAEIATEMTVQQAPLALTHGGRDWLDKPHFQFWPSVAAFAVFGHGPVQAQLPGLFFACLALAYTYLCGRLFGGRELGLVASVVLGTSLHFAYSANDIRAEVYLAGLGAMAFYHLWRWLEEGSGLRHLALGALAAACAFMTKGLFAVLPLLSAFAGNALLRRRVSPSRAALAIGGTMLFCLPSAVAYWLQFDAQPDKVVQMHEWGAMRGVSGVKFFLWDSQVGRFFNSGAITGNGHIGFFVHTMLWAFLPWPIYWYLALFSQGRDLWRSFRAGEKLDATLWLAVVPSFLLMNLSRFQLPHYVVLLFPFAAVQVALWLTRNEPPAPLVRLHTVVGYLFVAVGVAASAFLGAGLLAGAAAIPLFVLLYRTRGHRVLAPAMGSAAFLLLLNAIVIPRLLDRQCSTALARDIRAQGIAPERVRTLLWHSHDLNFTFARTLPERSEAELREEAATSGPIYVAARSRLERTDDVAVLSSHETMPLTTLGREMFALGAAPSGVCLLLKVR